jgi:hypothetical protein
MSYFYSNISRVIAQMNALSKQFMYNLTFNYVLYGFQNYDPIVLKVGIRDGNLAKEAQALQFFENHGAMELIDSTEVALLVLVTAVSMAVSVAVWVAYTPETAVVAPMIPPTSVPTPDFSRTKL